MRKNKIIFTLLSSAIFLSSCSLDKRYFSPRTSSNYNLDSDVIPAGQIEEVSFESNGHTLAGVFVSAAVQDGNTRTILYVHGDDKDIDKYWFRIEHLYPVGANIFIYDFQGYGKSEGKPSLNAIHQNTQDALDYIRSRGDVNDDKIIVYAFSLGGIFGTQIAATDDTILALITENIPASSDAVVRNTTRLGIPGSFFFNDTFDNLENLSDISAPVLMFHSLKDETVPYDGNAPLVFRAANSPNTQITVENGRHSDLISKYGADRYRDAINDFLVANGI